MKKISVVLIICMLFFNFVMVEATELIYGDADGSGVLTAADASVILQKVLVRDYLFPIENMAYNYMKIIDVDKDNILTSADCAMVLQKVLNSSYIMPCENNSITEVTTAATTVETLETTEVTTNVIIAEPVTEETSKTLNIELSIEGSTFNATIYDNPATRLLIDELPLTINMRELNGNEKYYFMDKVYPTSSIDVGYINAGDLMLYGNNCIVLFYESFNTSYDYTPLGYVDNPLGLANILGKGSVNVTFKK